jgi:cyclophilin family peptidyl-prolyl cis-trans isomerase
MIQGGQNEKIDLPTIRDEIGRDNRNIAGSIAMAKTSEPTQLQASFHKRGG